MSAVIKTIKDFFGNITYPITKTNAVYDSNNNRLDNILTSKQDASSNFVYKGTGSATPSIDDPELRQSDISTTQSTSDTTVPSSSLVKTMNDNLGNPSSASAVTGVDAFSKISKLNSELTNYMDITFENPSVTQYPQASVYYFGSGSLSALNGKQVVGITVVAYNGVKQMPIFTCNSDVRDVDKTIYGWVTSNGAVATKIVARVAYK